AASRLGLRLRWTAPVHALTFAAHHEESRGLNARLCPSACALVLFPAGRRVDDCAAVRARHGRPPARAGANRHRQHVRCARILGQDGSGGDPADRRLCACRRFCRSKCPPPPGEPPAPPTPPDRSPCPPPKRRPHPPAPPFPP